MSQTGDRSASFKEAYELAGNVFFVASYSLCIPPQIYLGFRYRTWGFLFGVLAGLILEVVGYAARVMMSQGEDQFNLYIVCLTVGPAFISASVYLCLARVITVYGAYLSRFKPAAITTTFMLADAGALILQSVGGAMVSQLDPDTFDTGMDIMQAGLGLHLAAIVIYVVLSCDFAYTAWSNRANWDARFHRLQSSRMFRFFLLGLAIATLAILTRTAFRVAELSSGFDSDIAKNETLFFILEGTMVLLACICLTLSHPGVAFGAQWKEADFHFRANKARSEGMIELT